VARCFQRQAHGCLSILVRVNFYSIFAFLNFISRNFAATQTIKIRCASYQKYSTRAAAQAAYDRAVERGEVETL
jgi:hypothetical protein